MPYRLVSRAQSQHGGERTSTQLGAGLEFKEHRAYEPGDEPRFIDWNAYARTGKLYTRRFLAERATRIYATTDQSASMQDKHDCVAQSLAWLRQTSRQDTWLERPIPNLEEGLTRLAQEKPGLVLLFSDGLEPPAGLRRGLAALAARGFDLSMLQVLSPDDLAPPRGPWRIRDRENNHTQNTDDLARTQYLARLERHLTWLASTLRGFGFRLARLNAPSTGRVSAPMVFEPLLRARILERGQ